MPRLRIARLDAFDAAPLRELLALAGSDAALDDETVRAALRRVVADYVPG